MVDGILLDSSARNLLADTALSLQFTRHTRAPLQEGDPAWALAGLQVNARLKAAAAPVLRYGGALEEGLAAEALPKLLVNC